MKKLLLIISLASQLAESQTLLNSKYYTFITAAQTAAACAGVSGPPIFSSIVTNRGNTIGTIAVTNNTVANCPRVHLAFLNHYVAGGTTITITNNLGVSGTLITNTLFVPSDSGAQMECYFWTNSTMTWALAKFGATVDNAQIAMMQLQNAATNSIISGAKVVNSDLSSSTSITNIVTSDTTSMVLSFGVADVNGPGGAIALAPNMTLRSADYPFVGTYTNVITTAAGASSVTNWINPGINYDGAGLISFSVKGYP